MNFTWIHTCTHREEVFDWSAFPKYLKLESIDRERSEKNLTLILCCFTIYQTKIYNFISWKITNSLKMCVMCAHNFHISRSLSISLLSSLSLFQSHRCTRSQQLSWHFFVPLSLSMCCVWRTYGGCNSTNWLTLVCHCYSNHWTNVSWAASVHVCVLECACVQMYLRAPFKLDG